MRPGKLLPLDEKQFDELEAGLIGVKTHELDDTVQPIIEAIQTADSVLVDLLLGNYLQQNGMKKFILELVSPLLTTVGELWAAGRLQIYQEHFISERLIRFLNTEIANTQKRAMKPKVLLATLPGEEHSLGLLMVAAMLSTHGITVINLGSQVPMDQIVRAADRFHADIVGITFSGAYQYRNIRLHLIELRKQIPEDIEIWTGGEGVRRLRKLPVGVVKFNSLEKLPL
jgi:methanogenic corrinoid protein MtbC1